MTTKSKGYAEALFLLAGETGGQEEICAGLRCVKELFDRNPDYMDLLASPNIPKPERLNLIDRAFTDSIPEDVVSFLKLLCGDGRIRDFDSCFASYMVLYEDFRNRSKAQVRSAVPLSACEQKQLKEQLERISHRTVTLECTVDPEMIGGLAVTMNGKIWDGSLRHQLDQIREVMTHE